MSAVGARSRNPERSEGPLPSLLAVSWWALQDLNLGPMDYESTALTAELRARELNLAQEETNHSPQCRRLGNVPSVTGLLLSPAGSR